MEMIVIYDNTGHIYYCAGGSIQEPVGLQFMKVTVPKDKILKSIDVSEEVHTPVFEDVPKSETDSLRAELESLNEIVNQLIFDNLEKEV